MEGASEQDSIAVLAAEMNPFDYVLYFSSVEITYVKRIMVDMKKYLSLTKPRHL